MALSYLRINIQPFEDKMGEACKECRKLVKSADFIKKYGVWKIADEEDPGVPSYKNSKTKKKEELGKAWKWDMWLPRAIAKLLGYPKSHPYWTVTANYANTDSGVTRPLWEVHKRLMQQREVWSIYLEGRKLVKRLTKWRYGGLRVARPVLINPLTNAKSKSSKQRKSALA
jgi:hypothetical protein